MDRLSDGWEIREHEHAGGPEDRYSGGGHATEEPSDGRQRAVNELVETIRQASRELASLMAEIEAERRAS